MISARAVVEWGAFGLGTPKPRAPKTARGRKAARFGRDPYSGEGTQEARSSISRRQAELKDKQFEQRQFKRMKERYAAELKDACTEYSSFAKWLRTLETELPQSKMPRNGYLDWDATEVDEYLKLPELPEPVRWMAFREFAKLLKRVTKDKYGSEEGPLLPFDEWKETDFEQMKRTLKLQ